MDFKQLLRAFLKDAYKLSDTEIDSLVNESDQAGTLTALLGKDQERVSKIKEPFNGKFEQGEKSGIKKAMTDLENGAKQKYGFDSDLQGIELIDAIIAAKTTESKGNNDVAKLTTEEIKQLPGFQPIQRDFNKQLNKTKEDGEKALGELKTGYEKKQTFSEVGKMALKIRNDSGYVIPANPKIASNTESSFLSALEQYDWQKQGDVWLATKDGKTVDDGHGNALTLESITKSVAGDWYDVAANNGGSNAGNGKAGESGTNGGSNGAPAFKTWAETSAYVADPKNDLASRNQALSNWEASQKNGTTV